MRTSHGHQIVGTTHTPLPEGQSVMRCGGPRLCKVCSQEVLGLLYERGGEPKKREDGEAPGGPTYLYN